jgi:hypothetical protein
MEQAIQQYLQLDPGIKTTVEHLQKLGLETILSCVGHPLQYESRNAPMLPGLPYVAVTMESFEKNRANVKKFLKKNPWNVEFYFRVNKDKLIPSQAVFVFHNLDIVKY